MYDQHFFYLYEGLDEQAPVTNYSFQLLFSSQHVSSCNKIFVKRCDMSILFSPSINRSLFGSSASAESDQYDRLESRSTRNCNNLITNEPRSSNVGAVVKSAICIKYRDGATATVFSDSLILEHMALLRLGVRCYAQNLVEIGIRV